MTSESPTLVGVHLNLVCVDFDATLAFYRLAGVDLPEAQVWRTASGAHHVGSGEWTTEVDVELDSPDLARTYNAGYAASPSPGGLVLTFMVPTREAVDELHARLTAAGHPSRQPPWDAFWGARYAIVADPDGRDVGFMSPSDDAHRSPPPDV